MAPTFPFTHKVKQSAWYIRANRRLFFDFVSFLICRSCLRCTYSISDLKACLCAPCDDTPRAILRYRFIDCDVFCTPEPADIYIYAANSRNKSQTLLRSWYPKNKLLYNMWDIVCVFFALYLFNLTFSSCCQDVKTKNYWTTCKYINLRNEYYAPPDE